MRMNEHILPRCRSAHSRFKMVFIAFISWSDPYGDEEGVPKYRRVIENLTVQHFILPKASKN